MIKTAICDDDKNIREYLKKQIENINDCQIYVFDSGSALLNAKEHFDILLLDIDLQDSNGIEIARHIRQYSSAIIIFITALKEYVFDAFDVGAFHYLLKPLEEEKFHSVFEKARTELNQKSTNIHSFIIKTAKGFRSVSSGSVLYAENYGRKIILHTTNEILEFYGKMDDFAKEAGSSFFRCHRGYLVNMQEIKAYDNTSITLKNNECIYLAKQKFPDFTKAYMQFLKNKENL